MLKQSKQYLLLSRIKNTVGFGVCAGCVCGLIDGLNDVLLTGNRTKPIGISLSALVGLTNEGEGKKNHPMIGTLLGVGSAEASYIVFGAIGKTIHYFLDYKSLLN